MMRLALGCVRRTSLVATSANTGRRFIVGKPALSSAHLKTKFAPVLSPLQQLTKMIEGGRKVAPALFVSAADKDITVGETIKIYELALQSGGASDQLFSRVISKLKKPEAAIHVAAQLPKVFNLMPKSGDISYTSEALQGMYDLCIDKKMDQAALEVIDVMQAYSSSKPTAYHYAQIAEIYMDAGKQDLAMSMVEKMQVHGLKPDSVYYGLLLKNLAKGPGGIPLTEIIYERMQNEKVLPTKITYYFLMEIYAKSDDQAKAWDMFQAARRVSVNPYTGMIRHLGRWGFVDRAFEVYEMMRDDLHTLNITPGLTTYNTLIDVCCANKQLRRGLDILDEMKTRNKTPTGETFTIMFRHIEAQRDLDMLKRAYSRMKRVGRLRADAEVINKCREWAREEGVDLESLPRSL